MEEIEVLINVRRVGILRRRTRAAVSMCFPGDARLDFSVEAANSEAAIAEAKRITWLIAPMLRKDTP